MKWNYFLWTYLVVAVVGGIISLATQQINWFLFSLSGGWFPSAIISENSFRKGFQYYFGALFRNSFCGNVCRSM